MRVRPGPPRTAGFDEFVIVAPTLDLGRDVLGRLQSGSHGTGQGVGFLENCNVIPTAREAGLNRQIERSGVAGGDFLKDIAASVKALEENTAATRANTPQDRTKAPAPLTVAPPRADQRPS